MTLFWRDGAAWWGRGEKIVDGLPQCGSILLIEHNGSLVFGLQILLYQFFRFGQASSHMYDA